MRAIVHEPGGPETLRLGELPIPTPGPGELLVAVRAAGVNRPDVFQRKGLYPPPPGASPWLGLEVAGTVTDVGPDVGAEWIGREVTALAPGGGYAAYCRVPVGQALPRPAGYSWEEAAALPETWFTVWHNLMQRVRLAAGETLLIHGGASGIGLTAIQLARQVGARCLVTVGSTEKQRFCERFGAERAINYHEEDFLAAAKAATEGAGADVILDMVGGDYLQRNLALLRKDGRLVMIAFLRGSKVDLDLMPVMLKRLVVTGSTLRPASSAEKQSIRDALLEHIWPHLGNPEMRPHVFQTFPLQAASEAHRLMESNRHIGKIVLTVQPDA